MPNIINITVYIYILYMFFDILIWELVNSYDTLWYHISRGEDLLTSYLGLNTRSASPPTLLGAGSWEVKTTYLLSTAAVAGFLAREDGKSNRLREPETQKNPNSDCLGRLQHPPFKASLSLHWQLQVGDATKFVSSLVIYKALQPDHDRITTGSRLVTYFASQIWWYL